jgi:hypothetical protein
MRKIAKLTTAGSHIAAPSVVAEYKTVLRQYSRKKNAHQRLNGGQQCLILVS